MPFTILKKRELVPTIHQMDVAAPRVAEKAMPGQFVILRIDECGERIPLIIADFDSADGTVTLIFQEIGKTTRQLASLGCASAIERFGTVVCVGGGVGIAPIFPIARGLMKAGNRVISIIGARSADTLFWEERMEEASSKLYVTTDDGTKGHHGFVTDIVQNVIESGEQVDRVIAGGRWRHKTVWCQDRGQLKPDHGGRDRHVRRMSGACGRRYEVCVRGRTRVRCARG